MISNLKAFIKASSKDKNHVFLISHSQIFLSEDSWDQILFRIILKCYFPLLLSFSHKYRVEFSSDCPMWYCHCSATNGMCACVFLSFKLLSVFISGMPNNMAYINKCALVSSMIFKNIKESWDEKIWVIEIHALQLSLLESTRWIISQCLCS